MALKLTRQLTGGDVDGVPYLPAAVQFSADRKLRNTRYVLSRLRQDPVWTSVIEKTDFNDPRRGRPRTRGEWATMLAAMVMSGKVDVQHYADDLNPDDWHFAQFAQPLSYPTAHRRLTELEDSDEVFWEAAVDVIRRVKAHVPMIGRVVAVDGTPFRTNGRLHHCCADPVACRRLGPAPGATAEQLTSKELNTYKQADIDAEEDGRESDARITDIEPKSIHTDEYGRPWRYYQIQGHTYRSRDTSAGFRMYGPKNPAQRGKRQVWHGGIALRAIDVFTGATIAIVTLRGDESEMKALDRLLEKVIHALGEAPLVITADKGFAYAECARLCAELGAELVAPLRRPGHGKTIAHLRTDQVDADHVIRCEHCGSPGTLDGPRLGAYRDSRTGQPRLAYRCRLGLTPQCRGKRLSYGRDRNWLLMNAIPRTSELYHALRTAHGPREHAHDDDRDNFDTFGKDYANMPHRPGIGWARLRGEVSLLVNWFRLGLRLGAITGHDRIHNPKIQLRRAHDRLMRALRYREASGIDLPYGKAAERRGFALPQRPPPQPAPG